jgi:membrane-bound metal-dependent hydrolase YbcI (DUF457 family)
MFAGHFAAGFAIKARVPQAPTAALLVGVTLLDLIFAPLVLLGIERITPAPGFAPGFSLDFIDWSHSLLMALIWSLLFAACFFRRGRIVMLAIAAAVFSHFVLDWLMHPGDLALYPHSAVHLGLGIWRLLPTGWWLFELVFIGLCCGYYLRRARQLGGFGGRGLWVCAVVLALHLGNSPWLAPTG